MQSIKGASQQAHDVSTLNLGWIMVRGLWTIFPHMSLSQHAVLQPFLNIDTMSYFNIDSTSNWRWSNVDKRLWLFPNYFAMLMQCHVFTFNSMSTSLRYHCLTHDHRNHLINELPPGLRSRNRKRFNSMVIIFVCQQIDMTEGKASLSNFPSGSDVRMIRFRYNAL